MVLEKTYLRTEINLTGILVKIVNFKNFSDFYFMHTHYLIIFILVLSIGRTTSSQIIYSNEQVDVIKLEENVFLLKENYKFTANCLAIAGDNELLLLDTGFGEVAPELADAILFLQKEVTVIVNSHGHPDHVGANGIFGNNVTIYGHENCGDELAKHGQEVVTIENSHSFDFAGYLVFCMAYTGGHSECDIMTFIPDLNLVYLGDIFLSESFPLVVLSAGSKAGILVDHLNEIFQSLPEETRLIPGHGKETTMEYLGGYISMVEETIKVVRKRMDSGKTLQEIKDADVLKKWGNWGEFFPFITKDTWIEQIYLSYSE
jgi:glyoxylase-like metal-dependent hydrolase (beta-lactamase superfamily II)